MLKKKDTTIYQSLLLKEKKMDINYEVVHFTAAVIEYPLIIFSSLDLGMRVYHSIVFVVGIPACRKYTEPSL